MKLHLLLSHADDHSPVLSEALALESVLREPQPPTLVKPESLYEHHGELNDLRVQGWAVVVPDGEAGERLLARVEPLTRFRAKQQHLKPEQLKIFKVPPGAGIPEANQLRDKLLKMQWEEQPRYLLLLGDAEQISFEYQQVLSVDRFVGRLGFSQEGALEAYVKKVIQAESDPPRAEQARALFLAVHDRTPATSIGYEALISPGLQSCQRSQQRGNFPASEVRELATPEDWDVRRFLSSVAEPAPSVLLTLSHGLGAPWRSLEEQRRRQGAMDLGDGKELRIEDVAHRPFLPGGLWFYFACFSAGTPARSMYAPWMRRLQEAGEGGRGPESVLVSAPKDGHPFIAAIPQAALANPDGPLAVIGHVDLAWMYSFQEFHAPNGQNHAARFAAVMGDLVKHRRAGVGLSVLTSGIAATDARLAMLYHQDEPIWTEKGEPLPEAFHRAHLWMTRHDLAGYILLGDPAVRLPIKSMQP